MNTMLMHECDIYFYEQLQDVQFSENQETYSMLCRAFACDGSGGEYVFLKTTVLVSSAVKAVSGE